MTTVIYMEPIMSTPSRPTALVTGASAGIGATYADRLARRGHDLVLVARSRDRLDALAARLRDETGAKVDVLVADLADASALAAVEARLRQDAAISLLVNNAGSALPGGIADQGPDAVESLIRLNVTAPARLAAAVLPRFLAARAGAIVNIASVLAVAPEVMPGIYPATKSFMLTLSQSLAIEAGPHGVYVQAVLPAATRTEIWDKTGMSADAIPGLMEVGDLVDAALVGFDRREGVTIPPLQDETQWDAFSAARMAMLPGFRQSKPGARYRA